MKDGTRQDMNMEMDKSELNAFIAKMQLVQKHVSPHWPHRASTGTHQGEPSAPTVPRHHEASAFETMRCHLTSRAILP